MSQTTVYATSPPIDVRVADGEVIVTLEDGRKISNPLAWFPWLEAASSEQQAHVELWPFSVDWPDLDNGLDVEGMLRGIRPKVG